MELKCIIAALIGGTVVYFILHGACNTKIWLKRLKQSTDKKLAE
jgi:hypothetical protein